MNAMIHRSVVRCWARSASISRRAAMSLASIPARALSTPPAAPPRSLVAMIKAAAIRSPAGSSSSAAKARKASSVPILADSRLDSAVTGPAIAAGALRALTSSASSKPRLAVSMSDSLRVHCSRPSSLPVRCRAARTAVTLGTKMTAAAAASAATGQRVNASITSPAGRASAIRVLAAVIRRAASIRAGGMPAAGALRVSSPTPTTTPVMIMAPEKAAAMITAGSSCLDCRAPADRPARAPGG